jgi:hypothetical protein
LDFELRYGEFGAERHVFDSGSCRSHAARSAVFASSRLSAPPRSVMNSRRESFDYLVGEREQLVRNLEAEWAQ